MSKSATRVLSLTLVLVMFVLAVPTYSFANYREGHEKLNLEIEELETMLADAEYLSKENKELVKETFGKPNYYIIESIRKNNTEVALFNTPADDITIAITDGHIEVIEQINELKFLINGDPLTFEYTYEEINDISPMGWYETGNPGGPWSWVAGGYHNYRFSKAIRYLSIGAMATFISAAIGGPAAPIVALNISFLIGGAANEYLSSSIARSLISEYRHSNLPNLYRYFHSSDSIYYKNSYQWVGTTTTYLAWVPGGP